MSDEDFAGTIQRENGSDGDEPESEKGYASEKHRRKKMKRRED